MITKWLMLIDQNGKQQVTAYLLVPQEVTNNPIFNLVLGSKRIPVVCQGIGLYPLVGGNPLDSNHDTFECEITKICNSQLIWNLLGIHL